MALVEVVTVLALLAVRCMSEVMITNPPQDTTVIERGNATFRCMGEENGSPVTLGWRFTPRGSATSMALVTGTTLTGIEMVTVSGGLRTMLTFSGVRREADGGTVVCVAVGSSSSLTSDPATLTVQFPPQFSPSTANATTTEGDTFTFPLPLGANPPSIDSFALSKGDTPITDERIAVNTTGLTIADVTRVDSGEYHITASNVAGSASFTLTVDVYYPPEFTVPSQNVTRNAARNEVFTFDCTPSAGNPAVYSYTFLKGSVPVTEGVSGSVLTINPVVRSSRGMYTCTANNTAGTRNVTRNLFVVDVPTMPLNPRVVNLMPFSATLQWDPPSDNGGSSLPLTYTVNFTNFSTSLTFSNTSATTLPLRNLQHSTQYSWSVQAINEYGSSPPAEGTFRTNDTVPTVNGVEAIALTVDTVQVDVTVSDDGGQPVLEYTVTVNGTTVMFSRSTGNVTGLSLMNGVTYSISVVARNRIGDSEIFTSSFSVPFPPNITMQPVAVTPDETTTRCCAGVRVFLEDPSDPTLVFTAQVNTEGSSFTARNVTREGDVVYVQGLQAGTPYNINLIAWNQFGSVTKQVSTTPLIGSPSDPSMPVVSVEGSSVSIQLSTRYPGTNAKGQFRFSLIFSAASTAKRQSLQPTEVRVDPTGLDSSVTTAHTLTDVTAGSYIVSVMAENDYGMSQEATASFVVQDLATAGTVDTAVVIGVVVAIVIVILLLILAIFIIVLVCMKRRDAKAMYKPKSEGSGDADYKEMVDTNSTDPLAPHYEDPSTLERQAPPPVVTYKKEEEAATVQPAPAASGVIYADLDFSRQQALGSKKPEKKKPEPIEAVVYSEVRLMTPQEKQQGQERGEGEVGGNGAEQHSPTTIM